MSTQDTATVLFSTPFTYERLGDHVDEIKFIQPVLVTHIRVADIAPPKAGSASQPPQLRIFARDLQCLGSSRFAPLCTSTISCQESGAQTYRTEVILTDHVIIRGRYTAVEFTLLGSTEAADDLDPQGKAEASANSAAAAVAAARRAWCSADGLAGAATPASAPPSVVSLLQSPGVLPVAAMPARMLTALQSAAAYYTEVGRSHGRIASNPPQGRLRAIMSAADTLYQALQGETSALEAAVAAEPLKVEDAHVLQRFVATAVELAVDWCQLLASDRSSTVTEVSVGLAGLAVALVLCSYPPTAATFMRAGGVTAATGILALPRPSSDMLRYASALCEMLTLSQGAAGCEVLLGWWVPPPLQVLAKEEEDVSMADVKSEGQQTPRTGVSGSVIKSEAEDRHGAAGGMEVDGGTLSLAEDGNGRTRDGGGHFGGVAGGGGSGSWAGLNGDEDDGTDQFYRNASNAPGRSAEVEEADAQEGAEEGAEHEQFAAEGEDAEQHAPAEVGSAEHEQAEDEEAAAAAAAPYNEQDDDGGHHVDDEAAAAALEEDELVAADDDEEPDAYGDLYGDVGGAEVDAEEDADEATGAAGGGGDEAAIGTSAGKRDGSDDEVAASMDLDGPAEEGGTAGQRGGVTGLGGGTHEIGSGDHSARLQVSTLDLGDRGDIATLLSPASSVGGSVDATASVAAAASAATAAVAASRRRLVQRDLSGQLPFAPAAATATAAGKASAGQRAAQPTAESPSGGRPVMDMPPLIKPEEGGGGRRDRSGKSSAADGSRSSRGRRSGGSRSPSTSSASSPSRSRSRSKHPRSRSRSRSRDRSHRRRGSSRRRDGSRSPSRRDKREGSRSPQRRKGSERGSSRSPGRRGGDGRRDRSRERPGGSDRRPAEGPSLPGAGPDGAPVPPVVHVAAALTRLMLVRPRPALVAAGAARVLQRLHAYDATARLGTAVSQMMAGVPGGCGHQQSVSEAVLLARGASSAINALCELLLLSMQPSEVIGGARPSSASATAAVADVSVSVMRNGGLALLPPSHQADRVLLQIMASRMVLPHVAGALHTVTLQLAACAPDLRPGSEAAKQVPALVHIHQQLVIGARALTAPLLSTKDGTRLVMTSPLIRQWLAMLADALDAAALGAAGQDGGKGAGGEASAAVGGKAVVAAAAGPRGGRGPGAAVSNAATAVTSASVELATTLRDALKASYIVDTLQRSALDAPAVSDAVESLAQTLLSGRASCASRSSTLQLLASSPDAVKSLSQLMRVKVHAYRAAGLFAGVSTPKPRRVQAFGLQLDEDEDEEEHCSVYHPQSLWASPLLLELVRDPHPTLIAAWLPLTSEIAEAARLELEGMAAALPAQQAHDMPRRWVLKELQGRTEAASQFLNGGLVSGLLEPLDQELLPELVAVKRGTEGELGGGGPGGRRRGAERHDVDAKRVAELVRAPDRCAQVVQMLRLLGVALHTACAPAILLQAQAANAFEVVQRAVRCAGIALSGVMADGLWSAQAGDCLPDLDRVRLRRCAVQLSSAAAHATLAFLQRLQQASKKAVTSRGLLSALLRFHAALSQSTDSLHASLGGTATAPSELLLARQQVSAALSLWTDAGWQPALMGVLFATPAAGSSSSTTPASGEDMPWADALLSLGGGAGPPGIGVGSMAMMNSSSGGGPEAREAAACSQSPQAVFTAMSVLGDLLPAEWPPASQSSVAARRKPAAGGAAGAAEAAAFPPPTHVALRAEIARSIEQCSVQFRRMVSFGAGCESRMVRCATVRVASKAAGLGGGMGPFLAAPLLEQLQSIMKGTGPLADARRVLEILVPLAFKPPMKAALLDLKAVSLLGRFSHRLVSKLQEEQPEAGVVLTMCLEALALLCNPELCLNPLAPLAQRLVDDFPPPAEASALVTALLACLPHLGGNAAAAQALLAGQGTGMAAHASGRAALRAGAHRWHVTQVPSAAAGVGGAGARGGGAFGAGAAVPDADALTAALSWAAGKLRGSGERFKSAGSDSQGVGIACLEVARALEAAASTLSADAEEASRPLPPPLPAPQRFLAAVEAARAAAGPSGQRDAAAQGAAAAGGWRAELVDSAPHALVCDAMTQAFWRYCKARAGKAALARKLTKWEVGSGARVPPASLPPAFYSQSLPEGLTLRKRLREAKQPGGANTAAAAAATAATGARGAADGAKRARGDDDYDVAGGASSVDDIPVIVAPRRRGDGGRVKFGSSSRPASRHVDEYEGRRPGGTAATDVLPLPPAMPLPAPPPVPLPAPPPLPVTVTIRPSKQTHHAVTPPRPVKATAPAVEPPVPVKQPTVQSPAPSAKASLAAKASREPPATIPSEAAGVSSSVPKAREVAAAPQAAAAAPTQREDRPAASKVAPGAAVSAPTPAAHPAAASATTAAAVAEPASAAAVPATQQQLMAVLRDPVKLKKLLETHPHLVGLLQQQLAPK